MAMLRRILFCCFPSEGSLQEPGIDSIVTDAVHSVEGQCREFLHPTGTDVAAPGPATGATAGAAVSQAKAESPDVPVANASGASSPGSTSKTAPGTPPLDTQEFSGPSGIFEQAQKTASVKAMSGSASQLLGDAHSWLGNAATGMEAGACEFLHVSTVEQKGSALEETARDATAKIDDISTNAVQEVQHVVKATFSAIDDAQRTAADSLCKIESEVAGATESANTSTLENAEDVAAAVVSAVDNAGSEVVDAFKHAEGEGVNAVKAMEATAVDALAQVEAESASLNADIIKTKATPSSVVSPTDIKAAANAAMRASSVMEHLAQRSVSSMSSVKSKVNAAVAPDSMPENSQSADEGTAEAGGSEQSTEGAPAAVNGAAGSASAAKKPKKKNPKKKTGKKKGKSKSK